MQHRAVGKACFITDLEGQGSAVLNARLGLERLVSLCCMGSHPCRNWLIPETGKISILRLNRGHGIHPRQQLTTGHTWGRGHSCLSPWAHKKSTEPSVWPVGGSAFVPPRASTTAINMGKWVAELRTGTVSSKEVALGHISPSAGARRPVQTEAAQYLGSQDNVCHYSEIWEAEASAATCLSAAWTRELEEACHTKANKRWLPYKLPCWSPGATEPPKKCVTLRKRPLLKAPGPPTN